MAHSEMASKLAGAIFSRASTNDAEEQADNVLAPVREVLEGLATKRYASFDAQFCWCVGPTMVTKPEGDRHEEHCLRARELYKQLEIA